MCKRPWADRPVADGTAARGRGEATLHQEPAEPPSLRARQPCENSNREKIFQCSSEPRHLRSNTGTENMDTDFKNVETKQFKKNPAHWCYSWYIFINFPEHLRFLSNRY